MLKLKKEHYRARARENIREWRKNNKELATKKQREYQHKRYQDPEFKKKKQEYMKKYRQLHGLDGALLPDNVENKPIGRPSIFKLSESLELLVL